MCVFVKAHDEARYDEYLKQAALTALTDKTAKDAVKTGALLPHELVVKAEKLGEGQEEAKMEKMEVNKETRISGQFYKSITLIATFLSFLKCIPSSLASSSL